MLYDSDLAQQQATRITIRGGGLYLPDGSPLDTAKMVTAFSGPGFAIYCVSAEGNLHVTSHTVGRRHHSSLVAGQPIACAGELQAQRGVLRIITNKSGHYKPGPGFLIQILRHFAAHNGLNLDSFAVRAFIAPNQPLIYFKRASDFLASNLCPLEMLNPPPMPKGPVYGVYENAGKANGPQYLANIPGPAKAPGPVYATPNYPNGKQAVPYDLPKAVEYLAINPDYKPPTDPVYLAHAG